MKKDLIVVGIGASAGGLEAINEFFDHIGPNTGMAFIVVQHLSPDFKSLMEELLAKHTEMGITVIRQDTPVEPNHVYLISKESNIIIEDNIIKPVIRKDRHVLNLPIDEFFHALGTDQRENSIGIILSGTGTDGSRGIATIKEVGGMVFVQDPDTAQFDGMPKTAMNTGLADEILSPFMIAKNLMNMTRSNEKGLLLLNTNDKTVSSHFRRILELVSEQIGVNFSGYRKTTLYRRIEKRMFLTHHKNIQSYARLIQEDRTEISRLYKEFLIGVTRFFRDTEAFDILKNEVIAGLLQQGTAPIRIWVAACSTGEEAYSIAMLFQDYLDRNNIERNYKIFASDLDAHAIDIASKGSFGQEFTDSIPPEFISKYFHLNLRGEFAVNKFLREKIVFTVHDALNDPPFINIDLVSCRNFLIYLEPSVQQKVLISFQFALKLNAYLFLGPSESLGDTKKAFIAINERWNIYKNISQVKLKPIGSYSKSLVERKRRDIKSTINNLAYEEIIVQANETVFSNWLLNRYVPFLLFVDDNLDVLYIHGDAERLLTFPRGPGGFNLNKMLEDEELLVFKNGIRKTRENNQTNIYQDITFRKKDNYFKLEMTFEPFSIRQLNEPAYLITIKIIKEEEAIAKGTDAVIVDEKAYHQERVKTLTLELQKVRSEKQSLVEQLETTNEELQSSNEELIAANEELQSTNEELQSVNEELYTVNSELQNKISELTLAHNDMDNLLKSTGIGTIFVDEELNIRKFTPAIQKQFHLVLSDIGRPITSFVNAFGKEKIYDDFKKVLKTDKKIEKEIVDDAGNHYLMRLLPYQLDTQERNGVVATFVDIRELKAAFKKAENLAEKFKVLSEHSEDYITSLNENLDILHINIVPEGYTEEEVIGANLYDLVPTESHKYINKALRRLNKTKDVVRFSMPVLLKTEILRWYDILFVPLSLEEDRSKYLLIAKDVTYSKTIGTELHRKAAIFTQMFKYIKVHILIMDKNGIIKDVNYTNAGFEKSDLVGKALYKTLPTKEACNKVKKAIKTIQEGADFYQFKLNFVSYDGLMHYYEDTFFPIILEDELDEIILIVRDLTEEVNAQQLQEEKDKALDLQMTARTKELNAINMELEEANSYLDSFVHGAAHDLRSPLTQMQGYLSLLPEIEAKEDRNAAYEELKDASHRMERILNGLVELISFKKNVSPIIRDINILSLCHEVIEDLKPYLNKAQANTIHIDIPEKLNIRYIEAFLNSVLYNLLHNAVKYRSYNRQLSIEVVARKEEEFVVIEVNDNGIGMDLQRYGHFLFQPFKRLTVERLGTGIGLSIINNSVRRNGGRIETTSFLNKGTTFKVYLKPYS